LNPGKEEHQQNMKDSKPAEDGRFFHKMWEVLHSRTWVIILHSRRWDLLPKMWEILLRRWERDSSRCLLVQFLV